MRRRFSRTVCRATSVGCAVKTGVIAIWWSAATASAAEIPASFMRPSVPRNEPGSGAMFAIQFAGAAAALAVVRLGQVGEFEVRRKGLGDLVGVGQVHARDDLLRLAHQLGRRGLLRTLPRRFAMLDQQAAQFFHGVEQVLAGLLHQHLPQDRA
jgi:hypothetical protein